jgi:tetratricopeptide (TPR) repeat protein
VSIIRCQLGVDGRLRDCKAIEIAPYGFTESLAEALRTFKYRPSLLAGHPIELPYTVVAQMTPHSAKPTEEQYLQWYRARTKLFPKSPWAWFGLAKTLAKQRPEDPEYLLALQHMNELDPHFWWSANELAWTHVQAGRYPDASPLAMRARGVAPLNPYVLETSAATLAGLGKCQEAVAEQQRAVKGLPAEWPAPERERFQQKLQEYTQHCQ